MTNQELEQKLRELQRLYDAYIAEGRPFEWGPMRSWHDAIDDAFPELRDALAQTGAMREARTKRRDLEAETKRQRDTLNDQAKFLTDARYENVQLKQRCAELERALAYVNPHANGLVSPCVSCEQAVPFDWRLADDELWMKIVPKKWWAYVLCLPCFDKLAHRAGGTQYSKSIAVIYFTGIDATTAFVPVSGIAKAAAGGETP